MTDTTETEKSITAWQLLKGQQAFRRLWLARFISVAGNAIGTTALLLYAANSTGPVLSVTLLMIVSDFAPTLFSPFTGTLADRLNRKWVMLGCELLSGLMISLIALGQPPLPIFLLLVGLHGTIGQLFGAASRSAMPTLVADADLEAANAALGFGTNGLDLVGPLLVAGLLPFFSLNGLLLIDAATYLIAIMLLLQLPALAPTLTEKSEPAPSFIKDVREGLGYIWHNPAIRVITLGFFTVVAFNAVDDVALVFLAKNNLHASDSEASLLYAGAGAGLLLGYAGLARFGKVLSSLTLLIAGYGLSSLGNGLTGWSLSMVMVFSLQLLRGIGLSFTDLSNNTLIQRHVPSHLLGRVFGNIYGAIGIAAGLSYLLGGLLLNFTNNPTIVFTVAGVGGMLSTVWVARNLSKIL